MQHLAGVRVKHLSLRREVVNLVDDQVARAARMAKQRAGEVDKKPRALADHPPTQVDDAGPIARGDQLGDVSAGVRVQWQIRVFAAEDDYWVSWALAAARRFQAPPISLRIDDAD